MSLELLANELLLDIFEFLNAYNLFRAFHGLNSRFNELIFIQTQRYHLDFRSISKHDFEFFCEKYLISINDRIVSFHLPNDTETPNLPQVFLTNGYRINQFIHLKSFSINGTFSFELLNDVLLQCHELSYLTHLSVTIENNQEPDEAYRKCVNRIWSLSKLTHCNLDIQYMYTSWLLEMSIISNSIEYLSIKNIDYNEYSLSNLIRHTPQIRGLHIGTISRFDIQAAQTNFSSLISLHIIVDNALQWIKNLFQRIPNLCYLILEVNNISLDGYAWENILMKYFPKIKSFRFKMIVEFLPWEDIEELVDQLLDSFKSPYWIEKHKWYVQCDWCSTDNDKTGLLYTLPYAFDKFKYKDGTQSKSTSLHDLIHLLSNPSETIQYIHNRRDFSKNPVFCSVHFCNIRHLQITFPFNDTFWSMVSRLDQLISLDVKLIHRLDYYQLQTFLDKMPHLYSLRISYFNTFSMDSLNINSRSIRRLEFFQDFQVHLKYFNREDCKILANSSIAAQCEVLLIDVEHGSNILEFFRAMPKLRALSVRTKYINHHDSCESLEIMDDLMEWFRAHLPSTYMYSITRNIYNMPRVNIWISTTS